MKSSTWSKAAIAVVAFGIVAAANASSFTTFSTIVLSTADLSAKGISISTTQKNPDKYGYANGTATVNYDATESFTGDRGGVSKLNFTITSFANGTAGGPFGTAYGRVTDSHLLFFYNTSNAPQTFSVDWSYNVKGTSSASNPESAFTRGNATLNDSNVPPQTTYFNKSADSSQPTGDTTNSASDSGSLSLTVPAGKITTIYENAFVEGMAIGAPAPAPEPCTMTALGLGVLAVLRRKKR